MILQLISTYDELLELLELLDDEELELELEELLLDEDLCTSTCQFLSSWKCMYAYAYICM